MRALTRHSSAVIPRKVQGFSLVELSVVIVIISVVAVAGLEMSATFMGRTAYQATTEKLTKIDDALMRYRKTYGRLPCPANRALTPASVCYGKEFRDAGANDCAGYTTACSAPTMATTTLYFGDVPVRDLGLPPSFALDAYGNKLNYIVGANLVTAGTAAGQYEHRDSVDGIAVRSGKIDTTCGSAGNLCQNRGTAAYFVFSNGADKRGAMNTNGVIVANCKVANPHYQIDRVNCRLNDTTMTYSNGGGPFTPNANIFYDSRYNNGATPGNFFDDIVKWRSKNAL
ncbi:MAG: hypothetical protein DI582_00685 [Azospirillum brasilense]|nr:MAG: hypothetical protein DI582_00685 [Azospirillum brasilense]